MDLSVPFVQQICKECGFDQREVERLSLAGEHIARLGKGLSGCQSLIVLDISRNLLTSLQGIEHAKQLRKLNMAHNKIASVEELARLRHLPHLVDVDLRDNPVCSKPDFDRVVIANVRKLRILNGEAVSAARVQQVRQQQAAALQQKKTRDDRKQSTSVDTQTEDDVLELLNNESIPSGRSPERRVTIMEPEDPPAQKIDNNSGLILQALDRRIRIWEEQFGLNQKGRGLDDSSSSDDGPSTPATQAPRSRPLTASKHTSPQPRPSHSPARMSAESVTASSARDSSEIVVEARPPLPASPPRNPKYSTAHASRHAQTRLSTGSMSSTDHFSPQRRGMNPHTSPQRATDTAERSHQHKRTYSYNGGNDPSLRASADHVRQELPKSVVQQLKTALEEIAQDAITRMEAVASSITAPPPHRDAEINQLSTLYSQSAERLETLSNNVQDIQHTVQTISTALLNVSEQQRASTSEIAQVIPMIRSSGSEADMKWQSCLDSIRQLEQVICGPDGVVLSLQRTNDELLQRVGSLQKELESTRTQHRLEMQLLQKQFDELAGTKSSTAKTTATQTTRESITSIARPQPLAFPVTPDASWICTYNSATSNAKTAPQKWRQPSTPLPQSVDVARISQQLQIDLKPL